MTSRRGAVGWSGAKTRKGPQLGPKTEHTARQHRDQKWKPRDGESNSHEGGDGTVDPLDSPKEEVKTRKFASTRPHRGPIALSPRSQLNFAFNNEATIAARMKEIREIAAVHREKVERRQQHPRAIMYDGGQRVVHA